MSASWVEAEKALGVRLDRRGSYRVVDGEVQRLHQDRESCSGCSVTPEETGWDPDKGFGCEECGYHGRRVNRDWVPLDAKGEFDFCKFFGFDNEEAAA